MLKISEDSLEWALKHIERYGDTDIFPVPFEFDAIRFNWDEIKAFLAEKDLDKYTTRPYRRCLSPKHYYGFRISTQLDPLDTLIYTALVYEIGAEIEEKRVAINKNTVFSYRFAPEADGRFFNPDVGYDDFLKQCGRLAETTVHQYVVVADIADFFPKIYSHPLENALCSLGKKEHARIIGKLIRDWNQKVSYGIPVGQNASRLLAELTISDVDEMLIANKVVYCRFSDDYRIFCETKTKAYQALALLANTLFENHGLTLQQEKTRIITSDEFFRQYLHTDRAKEEDSLAEKFRDLLSYLGIEDRYEQIDYDELGKDQQKAIDSLNLIEILEEELEKRESMDLSLARFVLRRLGQINNKEGISLVLKNLETLYPVFKDVVLYIQEIRRLNTAQRQEIGEDLIELLRKDSLVGYLEYHKCWVLNLFTHDTEWDNEKYFMELYNLHTDEFSRRELILAMGRAGQYYWFKSNKKNITQFRPWEKRAFLAAASCLPGDEAKHWYCANKESLDILESSVVKWAKGKGFRRT